MIEKIILFIYIFQLILSINVREIRYLKKAECKISGQNIFHMTLSQIPADKRNKELYFHIEFPKRNNFQEATFCLSMETNYCTSTQISIFDYKETGSSILYRYYKLKLEQDYLYNYLLIEYKFHSYYSIDTLYLYSDKGPYSATTKIIVIVICVVVGVILIGGTIYYFMNKKKEEEEGTEDPNNISNTENPILDNSEVNPQYSTVPVNPQYIPPQGGPNIVNVPPQNLPYPVNNINVPPPAY